ncbi:MAG: histidinol-phosphate transaminase [Candidatus Hydrogenedentota bacterium]
MRFQRDILKNVEGYVPGEQLNRSDIIKLNTNENPYPPSPKAGEAIRAITDDEIRKYPDPMSVELRRACAEQYGYADESWTMVGNGMDELLAMTIRTFVDPDQKIASVDPTYSLYEILVGLHGSEYVTYDLNEDYTLPEALFTSDAALCFIPRPNAPTGVSVSREEMERLCQEFKGIVYIDEAYADFADDSCMDFPSRFDNVIVGRTFSKSFALCGCRVGLAVANPAIINEFCKTKDSYNMNAVSQAAGLAAIQDYAYMEAQAEKIKATRARLTQELRNLGFTMPDSQANFLLAQWSGTPDAKIIFENLREKGILVRYFGNLPGMGDKLRISVGTDEETDALLEALAKMMGD